jgi:ribosomal protein S18 acetylase RimI-like enzyme
MSVVRIATESDLDAIAAMAEECAAETDRARIAALLRKPDAVFLVAEWGGSPTGYLVAELAGSTASIAGFCVETPALWPSVGQSLLREACLRLKDRAVKRVEVHCDAGDEAKKSLLASEKFVSDEMLWTIGL